MNNKVIKNIVIDGLFLALVAVFAYVPYLGIITVGILSFTTIHVLVLIAAALFGYKKGALVGLFLGIFSLLVAIQYPATLDYFCLNPFISILPRVLFGLISGLVFDFMKRRLSKNAYTICVAPVAAVLTFLHTLLFLTCFYIFGVLDIFGITRALGVGTLIDNLNDSYGSFFTFIVAYVSIGAVCEIAIAAIITPICFRALANVTNSYSYLNRRKLFTFKKADKKEEENELKEENEPYNDEIFI